MGLHYIDWLVLIGSLSFITIYGIYVSKKSKNTASDFFVSTAPEKWWAIGLSVMATQASAITFMSTPGQAYHDGMGFVQVYFGLPLAMIIICVTFIPIYHKLNVTTAYEYLENRFDNKTRILTSILFLIQRGLGAGITIYAPSIILSTILGWNLTTLNIIIGGVVIIYAVTGGAKAINVTQKHQMTIMLGGMMVAFFIILKMLPDNIGLNEALAIAGSTGRMKTVDFSFNMESRYTFWSGLTGGLFLALSYFGTDQSQVQRYLNGKNIRESRLGLIFNGIFKVPMQFLILLTGIMVFVFYQYHQAPIFFNGAVLKQAKATAYSPQINSLESDLIQVYEQKHSLLATNEFSSNTFKTSYNALQYREKKIREDVKVVIKQAVPASESNDKDYVFISFILDNLPTGMIGLMLSVIFCAAMSSSSSEISALATCMTTDIYKRNFAQDRSDIHYHKIGQYFTILWGIIAICFANISSLFENLIQFVNIVGSIFYGTILGVFLCGFYIKRIGKNNVFYAAIITEIAVIIIYKSDILGYLWLNAVGCAGVVLLGLLFSLYKREDF